MAEPSHGMATNYAHLKQILANYLSIWNGNLSLLDATLSPTISFNADRFPSPKGGSEAFNITTREEFRGFVLRSRTGWDKYEFKVYSWTGHENHIAVRWKLDAVIGANFTALPTTLKQGDPVTYNGTDFLILNPHTGLIEELHMAQDLITLFHNLGLTSVTV
ncbi:hypothetical protein PISL3812_08383 [Talaromyces islandicus]|uniref:SnoaL-like domain-containing protein n=1 Tax=Talaromyces islandicus TaxID=28573 RepID=A0A0U1M6Y6_TALIS|nr:hypothetical protein PISL3812_08383 [Talaromyces islandicus]